MSGTTNVRLEPWTDRDLPLVQQLMGDPAMTAYLGGPESPEKLAERQTRYERLAESGKGRMFKIVDVQTGDAAGSVGYWERSWHDQQVYEMGWSVLPAFQRRGIATAATKLAVAAAAAEQRHRFVHAYPSVDNLPSNAVCKTLGFEWLEKCEFEFPPGNRILCHDWRLDLFAKP